jgi:peptidoglycan-associated lipoprotein
MFESSRHRPILLILALGLLVAGSACRARPASEDLDASAPAPSGGTGSSGNRDASASTGSDPFDRAADGRIEEGNLDEEVLGAGADAEDLERRLEIVYFEFNRAALTEEARMALNRNLEMLRQNPSWSIRIEGHCDERGTVEYNLALGDRRAAAVREFLIGNGVAANRVETVSYGEERPADPGHDEAAWARNRRAEFHAR